MSTEPRRLIFRIHGRPKIAETGKSLQQPKAKARQVGPGKRERERERDRQQQRSSVSDAFEWNPRNRSGQRQSRQGRQRQRYRCIRIKISDDQLFAIVIPSLLRHQQYSCGCCALHFTVSFIIPSLVDENEKDVYHHHHRHHRHDNTNKKKKKNHNGHDDQQKKETKTRQTGWILSVLSATRSTPRNCNVTINTRAPILMPLHAVIVPVVVAVALYGPS